ncbi:MAG: translation initiation factor IF-2 [Candidatus Spechtbacteria bacterium]|nr:translation initiation factor IF-2 [Candidatus Spechtbacteria bacterium]
MDKVTKTTEDRLRQSSGGQAGASKQYKVGTRPPVVVILGHVDHGKTSILDYIRKSRVAEKETGGITQHVGAYQVLQKQQPITFLDTPGHEAFHAMRARGAHVADIALLVVAAEDGIKPQTKEAIQHIKQAAIPYIVVMNKMDKPAADAMKVKTQLLEEEVLVEGFGGTVPVVEVSAKTGAGIEELLDTILLLWEVEGTETRIEGPAKGAVIESFMDSRRGFAATLLVREGELRRQDIVATNSVSGKIKSMEDFLGRAVDVASTSMPVLVLGLQDAPEVGDKFEVFSTLEEAQAYTAEKSKKDQEGDVLDFSGDRKVLNLILKADVHGSLEAVHELVRALPSEHVILRVLFENVGDVNESDVKLASSGKAVIISFRVGVMPAAQNFAHQMGVTILSYDIIYNLVQGIREVMEEMLINEIVEVETGKLRVIALFRTEKNRMIVGGRVIEGEAKRGAHVSVMRNEEKIGEGKIIRIKIQDKDMEKVNKGDECGVLYEGGVRIEVGDVLEFFSVEKKKMTV